MLEIAKLLEKKTSILTYLRSLENILLAVKKSDNFWTIVRYSGEPLNLVAEGLRLLAERNYINFSENKIYLSRKGVEYIKRNGLGSYDYTCDKCKGKGILIENLDEDIVKEFLKIHERRPSAMQEFDQGYVAPEITLARIAFMDSYGDLRGRKVLILGDDDLVSLAIGLTGFAKEIAVIEIDKRLTDYISEISRKYGFDIEIYTRDLREPLPDDLVGRFDTFQTDPPETIKALRLFIGRGIAALHGERCAGYFGLTRIDASLDKWLKFQKMLTNEFKVVITDIVRDFNEYIDWEYLDKMHGWKVAPVKIKPESTWFVSSQYRIETLRGFRGFNEPMIDEDIYVDEELASA